MSSDPVTFTTEKGEFLSAVSMCRTLFIFLKNRLD